jgi:hypothetical protein
MHSHYFFVNNLTKSLPVKTNPNQFCQALTGHFLHTHQKGDAFLGSEIAPAKWFCAKPVFPARSWFGVVTVRKKVQGLLNADPVFYEIKIGLWYF